ncbi:hypothetical protein OE88DRAFT_1659901 [Heliocybe sulcata]|uniref:Uncharacterized protein n=1 Tax=Heliocybe sulcata TaxID=5364 RepID=A0A5C3N0X4_9AGAM|nr:hypothetical protein OE88DRAFT_1659901 [Heliocybe sulcata]
MSSSSSTSPTQTPYTGLSDTYDKRVVAIGISLGVLGFLVIVGIIFWVLRLRRRARGVQDATSLTDRNHQKYLRHTDVDERHPANRVIPFGAPGGETPRFTHTPGANMRIATRRSDGAWDFIEPGGPLTPAISHDTDSMMPPSPSSTVVMGSRKDTTIKPWQFTNRDFEDLGSAGVPPPAYDHDLGTATLSKSKLCF